MLHDPERQQGLPTFARCIAVVVCLYFAYDIFLNDDAANVASALRLQAMAGW